MRLLCVIPSYWPAYQFGGPVFSVHALNKALLKKGIDVSVYTTNVGLNGRVPNNQEVDVNGVKVTYFAFTRFFEFLGATGWQFSLPMTAALRGNLRLFDVIYIVAIWNYPIAIAAHYCRRYKKPYIISPRGLLYPYTTGRKAWKKWPYYQLITKKDLQGAAAIHYTTRDESERCHLALGLKNTAVVIPNGIDLCEFKDLPSKEKLRQRYPTLKDKKVILFLGRINWKKGLDILIEAHSVLTKKRNDVHLLITGNDEAGYIRKVKRWVREYGIGQRVTFTGILTGKEKLEAYAGSDIFVLPSYSENFGIAVVEAMACGLPVIISNQVGIYKEVSGAEAGVVIETDAQQLAKTMENLLDNPHICNKMGENGKHLVNEMFRLDTVADEMIKLYEVILRPR